MRAATVVHRHLLLAVADEVTVLTGRQPRLEGLVKASLAHGEVGLHEREAAVVCAAGATLGWNAFVKEDFSEHSTTNVQSTPLLPVLSF